MIHEIHLTHSLLVREQHYTPGRAAERDLEEKKGLSNGVFCFCVVKWLALPGTVEMRTVV